MKQLGPGRFSYMNHFAVFSFHGSRYSYLGRQLFTNSCPAKMDSLPSQFESDAVQEVVGKNGNKYMSICSYFFLVMDWSKS